MKSVIIFVLLIVRVLAFEEVDNSNGLLGILTKDQKVFIKDGISITRELTACAKNKGWLQPLVPYPGITPITEIDILNAIGRQDILIVDMRKEFQYWKETIPSAINVEYKTIENHMDKLGCDRTENGWDCSRAKKIYGFCNGPVCPQSPTAMKKIIENGFPVEKIYYYRGGIFAWHGLGLTTVAGN